MNQVTLDPHGEMLMQQYRELLPTLEEVAKKAYDSKLENITALYLPFWTFDSYTITSYIDELHYPTGGGNIYSRYFKGVWGHNFDDLVIFASDRIQTRGLKIHDGIVIRKIQ